MQEPSKRIKRLLREQAGLAHEEELRRALLPLAEAFDEWRAGRLGSGGLSEAIHAFHQGPAVDLFKRYNYGPLNLNVAYAILTGVLNEQDVPAELLEYLEPAMAFYRDQGAG